MLLGNRIIPGLLGAGFRASTVGRECPPGVGNEPEGNFLIGNLPEMVHRGRSISHSPIEPARQKITGTGTCDSHEVKNQGQDSSQLVPVTGLDV